MPTTRVALAGPAPKTSLDTDARSRRVTNYAYRANIRGKPIEIVGMLFEQQISTSPDDFRIPRILDARLRTVPSGALLNGFDAPSGEARPRKVGEGVDAGERSHAKAVGTPSF
ncbi:hypothetical protein [Methylobacterium sp. Leaf112]|uniref:hypothetical protein n=1 Tax=Methylobacterium sp. Leaf112 TaxID=1736258 RepID=UPI000B26D990|nr:hypothetical protein [Methylobacterium sp. Leaf112]